MYLSYRGSVNSWECDENDHLNVRFYVEKHCQTLCGGINRLGMKPQLGAEELLQQVSVQHIRFIQESRIAAPLSGYVGIVQAAPGCIDVLTELRHSFTDEPLSTCVHRLSGGEGPATDELPDNAGPRGLIDQDLAHAGLALHEVGDYGFSTIGMGVVQSEECSAGALLRMHNYMGRISDSMPHLWGLLHVESGELDEDEGGVVLEYRLRYHQPLKLGQHFVINSGVSAVGTKVQQFAHLLFEVEKGGICVSAEAASVRLDLRERRAMVMTEEMLVQMRSRLVRPFTS